MSVPPPERTPLDETLDGETLMSIEVRIPTVLRKHTDGEATVDATGVTLRQVLDSIEERHPGFRGQVLDDEEQLHRFINVYVNDEDVRYLQSLETTVSSDDVVSILPAVAGG